MFSEAMDSTVATAITPNVMERVEFNVASMVVVLRIRQLPPQPVQLLRDGLEGGAKGYDFSIGVLQLAISYFTRSCRSVGVMVIVLQSHYRKFRDRVDHILY